MAKRKHLEIKPVELTELQFIARSGKAEKRLVERARIILYWNEGKSFVETQQELGVSEVIINKWRQRFSKYGLEGLKDAPRSGKPPVYSAAKKASVIALATKRPGKGYTSWSQRRIAKQVGMSQSKIQQILKQADLKPHKIEYWCGKSTDVEFESKMINIV